MNKDEYDWYKSKGICPHCGRNEHAPGRIHCLNCLEIFALCKMKQRGNMTEEERKKETKQSVQCTKERYARLKASGICVRCAKRKAVPGKAACSYCLGAAREYHRLRRLRMKEKGDGK